MTEKLLQFIWQFQYFSKSELETTDAEPLYIENPGQLNTHQGPDFSDAKIRIGKTTWAGSVELHIKASDWSRHKHQHDKNYDNVILHVVWEDDGRQNEIPVLELAGRVSRLLLRKYEALMSSSSFIPCGENIGSVSPVIWQGWKERLLAERLLKKAELVKTLLAQNNTHWEETFWWLLARNFGAKVNSDAFEAMARSVPLNILSKHKNQVQQLEALLLGQSGLLEKDHEDEYAILLKREYYFLKSKYKLRPIDIPVHFLRMRPGNFPTIRLAQLAMLIHHSSHLFAKLKDTHTLKDARQWLDITANDYWHYHYHFGDESVFRKKKMGEGTIDNIVINTVAPVLFAYGDYYGEQQYKDKALEWLEQTAPELNTITTGFIGLGIENKNAFDSQGLLELKTKYCDEKRCLECGVGNSILMTVRII